MYIMIFHPDNDNYQQFKLKRLEKEVNDMIAARLRAVKEGRGKNVSFDKTKAPGTSAGNYGFLD
jgi:hypothetical protein